jgi:hypothetical protein
LPSEVFSASEHWFLESVRYRDDLLEVRIAGGVLSDPHDVEVLGVQLGEGRSIELQPFSPRLAIRFRGVAAYQTYDESFSRPDKHEPDAAGVLREYVKSEYLGYLRSATYFPHVRTGRLRHFALVLEDAILDVVAEAEPEITELTESMLEADA